MRTRKLLSVIAFLAFLSVLIATPVSLYAQNERSEQEKFYMEVQKLVVLSQILCAHAYPKPTIDECFDKIYHGMASSLDPHSRYSSAEEQKEEAVKSQGPNSSSKCNKKLK